MTPSGAKFSRCRRWRYLLWRCWDASRPVANFLMLNPSTADEVKLDPSCTRARRYAERWGYGALVVTNLFGWRATDPAQMKRAQDPVGPGNDAAIVRAARECAIVVCAWGNHGAHLGRSAGVLALLSSERIALHALKLNGDGEPAHPLYLPGSLGPRTWKSGSEPDFPARLG
ncbi:MAG TPA: DUF1643 domain-containing protein [Burkholderiales bacterium]|nr:DUF1643 domain-containing protein [Burkholderiales bacterium]